MTLPMTLMAVMYLCRSNGKEFYIIHGHKITGLRLRYRKKRKLE